MTPHLHQQIQDRLLADEGISNTVFDLVDAACEGSDRLTHAIAELEHADPSLPKRERAPRPVDPPGAYLSTLRVAGFRGIGPEQTLQVAPGPGLTLLLGRNGSGKSSLAEGLETLLIGEAARWSERKEWRDGWKNLHARDEGAHVEAEFAVEGGTSVVVRRGWAAGAELESSELRVRRGSERLDGLAALGWETALTTFRPFLSHAELGALLARPSELYDKLKGILGLEEVAEATKRLAAERKARADRARVVKDAHKRLLTTLREVAEEDPRARTCTAALDGRKWDLHAVERVVLGGADGDGEDREVHALRRLAQLTVPTLDDVGTRVTALREAVSAEAVWGGATERSHEALAQILASALDQISDAEASCPVCEAPLSSAWRERAQARLEAAQRLGGDLRAARDAVQSAVRALRAIIRPVPPELLAVEGLSLPVRLRDAWQAWVQMPEAPMELCAYAETAILGLHDELGPFRQEVQARLEQMESRWRPVALRLAQWLATAKQVAGEASVLSALTAAEKWLKGAEEDLRDARFEPIATRSQEIWSLLRQQSHVELSRVKLEGKGTRRRVSLNVAVDGQDGVALSVMSQGELNALALSLFLPRMTLPESPFRFLVIDDPVQAMDPHKVDGLARVLEDVAQTRQVIVLTHDARLFEAVRRLGIRATAIRVDRRAASVVEFVVQMDPVERHLKDALCVTRDEQAIGPGMAARVVPGYCRLALEAAAMATVRRRCLGRGDDHVAVEERIEAARGIHALVTLAVYDDADRGGDVFGWLNNRLGRGAADTFRAIKEGAHGGAHGSLETLVAETRKLAQAIGAVR